MLKSGQKLKVGQKLYVLRHSQNKVGYRVYKVISVEKIDYYLKDVYRYGIRDLNRPTKKVAYVTGDMDLSGYFEDKSDLFKYYHNELISNPNLKIPEQLQREIKAHIKKHPEYWV